MGLAVSIGDIREDYGMTNGERIQTILDVDRDCTEVHGENGTMTFTVTQDFWNAEYKEPTTKNDLGVDCISRKAALDITWQDPSYSDPLNVLTEVRDKIRELPSVTPQLSSELEKNSKLEKIRDQLKSNLRGVEITLEVLVENDPLRPKMEGAKTTLEDCLELIEQAEAESI